MVANRSMDMQLLFAGIVFLTILAVALYLVVALTERLIIAAAFIAGRAATTIETNSSAGILADSPVRPRGVTLYSASLRLWFRRSAATESRD